MVSVLERMVPLCFEPLPYCVNDCLPEEDSEPFPQKKVSHITEASLLCFLSLFCSSGFVASIIHWASDRLACEKTLKCWVSEAEQGRLNGHAVVPKQR